MWVASAAEKPMVARCSCPAKGLLGHSTGSRSGVAPPLHVSRLGHCFVSIIMWRRRPPLNIGIN